LKFSDGGLKSNMGPVCINGEWWIRVGNRFADWWEVNFGEGPAEKFGHFIGKWFMLVEFVGGMD